MDKELKTQRVDQLPVVEESALEEAVSRMESQSETRRGFIKKAISTAPVILTLTAGPVWARQNCTWSGQHSVNPSLEPCYGEGCSPGFWKNHLSRWHYNLRPDLSFDDCVGVNVFGTLTLEEVIKDEYVDPEQWDLWNFKKNFRNMLRVLGFQTVAALQNSATEVAYPLTVEQVMNKFRRVFRKAMRTQNAKSLERLKDLFDQLNNQGGEFC